MCTVTNPVNEALAAAYGIVTDARRDVSAAELRLARAEAELRTKLGEHLDRDRLDLEIGTWECGPSLIGVCVYDTSTDPALDQCLFCGDPDERK